MLFSSRSPEPAPLAGATTQSPPAIVVVVGGLFADHHLNSSRRATQLLLFNIPRNTSLTCSPVRALDGNHRGGSDRQRGDAQQVIVSRFAIGQGLLGKVRRFIGNSADRRRCL